MLGKIENNLARNKLNRSRLQQFAQNLVTYIETQHTDIHHPKHKEKQMGYGKGKGGGKKPPKR
jgi:regulator of sigma D